MNGSEFQEEPTAQPQAQPLYGQSVINGVPTSGTGQGNHPVPIIPPVTPIVCFDSVSGKYVVLNASQLAMVPPTGAPVATPASPPEPQNEDELREVRAAKQKVVRITGKKS